MAPGFAFAHARPSAAVHQTTMSWVRLVEPVEFGHKNDPVNLVVALAATDTSSHQTAMAELATLLTKRREDLDSCSSPAELKTILSTAQAKKRGSSSTRKRGNTHDKILTICGNGLGTSLFLKNTVDEVLDIWGWSKFIDVEATDTISAKGKSKQADLALTSGEIARTLGDIGIPVHVIDDFTSKVEIDAALRELYDI